MQPTELTVVDSLQNESFNITNVLDTLEWFEGKASRQQPPTEIYVSNAILTASWQPPAATDHAGFDLGTCDVDAYKGDDVEDADADGKEEESQADDR
jgi:hypothetical protein